jgi:RNA polymerase sigma factor (sigma-70 family)
MSEATASLSHGHVPVAALGLLGDEALARRVADGDGQAFAALYRRHHQALYRYCRAILGNAEDAADALQNTMTSALRALPGEQRELRVKPWLYRIAHNESITLARRRPPVTGLDHAIDIPERRGSDPATRERLRQLFADLHALQDRQRAALVMRELNGLGYDEIGSALASNPAAAKQLVYEARMALHEMAEGREMSCEAVRTSLSADDGRKLRGRKHRAHMKACASCREFQHSIGVRQRDLAALAPPLPVLAATSILHGLAGGGHAGAASSAAGLAGGGTGKAVATSALAKSVAAVAVVATVGTGTAGLTGNLPIGAAHKTQHETGGTKSGALPAAGLGRTGPRTTERKRSRDESRSSQHRMVPGEREGGIGSAPTPAGIGSGLSHRPSVHPRQGTGRGAPRRSHAAPKPHPGPGTARPVTPPRKPGSIPSGAAKPDGGEARKPAGTPALEPAATDPSP